MNLNRAQCRSDLPLSPVHHGAIAGHASSQLGRTHLFSVYAFFVTNLWFTGQSRSADLLQTESYRGVRFSRLFRQSGITHEDWIYLPMFASMI